MNESGERTRVSAPTKGSRFTFRVHARALAALGRDLVTDDVVAVMELVKNSYDALATRVDVRVRPTGDSPGARATSKWLTTDTGWTTRQSAMCGA